METIILIIFVVAAIFAVIGFISSGGKKEDAAAGAVAGAMGATGCIVQLILYAIPVFLGLLLLGLIF